VRAIKSGEVDVRVWRAARLTGLMTATLAAGLWFGIVVIGDNMTLSNDATLALSLLKVGSLAIVLSSLKRPFVSGLIALYQERAVCRVNLLSALAGLVLVPAGIVYFNLWGPVVAWLTLEAAACALLMSLFMSVTRTTQANQESPLTRRAAL
jgi:O-antigen/teichoic acid export membrane protein